MRGLVALVFLAFTALIFSSCSTRVADFTLLSTKNIGTLSQQGERVQGEDCVYYLLAMIPLGNLQPNLKTAIDSALQNSKGNVLIDGVVSEEVFIFPFVWSHDCVHVEGTIRRSPFSKDLPIQQ